MAQREEEWPRARLMSKACRNCREVKPLTDFHKHPRTRDGRGSWCKECAHKRTATERKNPEARAKWLLYSWRSMLRERYGINEQQYLAILASQDGGCALCGAEKAAEGQHRRLHVDHCHVTGMVRGLLCSNCNNGIGRFKDDPGLLRAAAEYLERYRVKEAAE